MVSLTNSAVSLRSWFAASSLACMGSSVSQRVTASTLPLWGSAKPGMPLKPSSYLSASRTRSAAWRVNSSS
jgi:hypothetical protein